MNESANARPVILFVDDEANAVKYFQLAIGGLAPVVTAGSTDEGKRLLDAHADSLRVLVSDQRMPGGLGNTLLEYANDRYPDILRILTTAYSELGQTIDAVNEGQIYRYLQKPWEIDALRMELKHALEAANLRKEHALLLREKLTVGQKQVIANRIGTLYTVCAMLSGRDAMLVVDMYLSGTYAAGLRAAEPDWLLMDYSDLVDAEAMRNANFAVGVSAALSEFTRHDQEISVANPMDVLALTGDFGACRVNQNEMLLDRSMLTEYLESKSGDAVSPQHAHWLGYLIWLRRKGASLQFSAEENGVRCSNGGDTDAAQPAGLADWIERF